MRVRETTAWTLGRICQFVHGPHIDAPVLDKPVPGAREGVTGYALIVNSCLESVADDPKVAEQICSVVYHLASGFEEVTGNSPLSPFFPALATKLLECAARSRGASRPSRRSAEPPPRAPTAPEGFAPPRASHADARRPTPS